MRALVKADVAGLEAGGPHQTQFRAERAGDGHRQNRIDVEQHHDALFVYRRKDDLPHSERRVRISEDRRFGPRMDRYHDVGAVNVERVALQIER